MVYQHKKWVVTVILLQLLVNSYSYAYDNDCNHGSLPDNSLSPVLILAQNGIKIVQETPQEILKKEIRHFFSDLDDHIKNGDVESYKPPMITIKSLSKDENNVLNKLLNQNAKIILEKKLYSSNTIPSEIYTSPNVISFKNPQDRNEFMQYYSSSFNLQNDDKGIMNTTSAVAVGAIIGWAMKK